MNASEKRYASNHKVTRISLHAWLFLKEMSVHTGLSMAEALDKLLLGTEHIPEIIVPVVSGTSSIPVNAATTTKPKLVYMARPKKPVSSIDGDKHTGLAIRAKGGNIQ